MKIILTIITIIVLKQQRIGLQLDIERIFFKNLKLFLCEFLFVFNSNYESVLCMISNDQRKSSLSLIHF